MKSPNDEPQARARRHPAASGLALLLSALMVTPLAGGTGCATRYKHVKGDDAAVVQAEGELAEHQLLDVGIEVFDPGLDEDGENGKYVFPEVREGESRFVPYRLKETLQESGQWGSVRVVPALHNAADVRIAGEIVESDGERLKVKIVASDSTGREWLRREYDGRVNDRAYDITLDGRQPEPFQPLYNRIANDILDARAELERPELAEIQRVTELRFAAQLSPEAFSGYLSQDEKGVFSIRRLPARGDTMMDRVEAARERDAMLVDMLNEYYADFYMGMDEPYWQWRAYTYEEVVSERSLNREATWRMIGGAVGVAAGIALLAVGGIPAGDVLAAGAIALGTSGIKSGFDLRQESQIHADTIRELGTSFEADVAPMVVEVEGHTVRISGSAETQYETWRLLLRDIYTTERGLAGSGIEGPDFAPGDATVH